MTRKRRQRGRDARLAAQQQRLQRGGAGRRARGRGGSGIFEAGARCVREVARGRALSDVWIDDEWGVMLSCVLLRLLLHARALGTAGRRCFTELCGATPAAAARCVCELAGEVGDGEGGRWAAGVAHEDVPLLVRDGASCGVIW